ncbi:Uncharacterized protein FWK35_00027700, partial [Aphis craccivora]
MIRSEKHEISTIEQNKIGLLNWFDNKRYLIEGGTNTLSWGHYKIEVRREDFIKHLKMINKNKQQFVFDSRQCNTCVPYFDLLALDSKVTQRHTWIMSDDPTAGPPGAASSLSTIQLKPQPTNNIDNNSFVKLTTPPKSPKSNVPLNYNNSQFNNISNIDANIENIKTHSKNFAEATATND